MKREIPSRTLSEPKEGLGERKREDPAGLSLSSGVSRNGRLQVASFIAKHPVGEIQSTRFPLSSLVALGGRASSLVAVIS